jgi:DNA-binding transcriptional MocR family regulator
MLVHAVMEGFISPGQALPSSRLLAETPGLSSTTVTLTMQALLDKGLIAYRERAQALRAALAQYAPGLIPVSAQGGSALWVSAGS